MNNLYRGTSHFFKDGIYQNENINRPREPKTTPKYIHKAADAWFKEKFGIYARSQTIFCTPCRNHAEIHFEAGGSLLEISLTGKNNALIYCPDVNDFLDIIPAEAFQHNNGFNFDITKKLDELNYKLVSRVDEIPSSFTGEVMLFCEEYKVKNVD
jgi:hypothetical protein